MDTGNPDKERMARIVPTLDEVSPTLTSSNDYKDGGLCMCMSSPELNLRSLGTHTCPYRAALFFPSCFGKAVKNSKVVEINEDEPVSEEQMILQV